MSSCVVPHCRNLLQEWIAPFPVDPLLQTRWKHCIELGTSELLPEVDVLASAVVCNMHFLGFCQQQEEQEERQNPNHPDSKGYRQPTLFFRDDLVVEIESCCLCTQVGIKDDMVEKDSRLTKGLTVEGIVKMVLGETYFDDDKTSEYVCEMCAAKVDVLLTIYKHWEAGQLVWKTLRFKHSKESVQFMRNGAHAIALPNELAAMLGPVEEEAKEKPVKGTKRKKKARVAVVEPDVPSNPLETVIKVEEAVLQEEFEPFQSIDASEPAEIETGKETVTIPQENPDLSVVKVVEKTKAEILAEVKRTCFFCDTLLSTTGTLLTHLLMSHNDPETWKCPDCKLQFKGIVECNNHLKMHDVRRPLKCDHCPLRFTNPGMKQYHYSRVHPGLCPLGIQTNPNPNPNPYVPLTLVALHKCKVVPVNQESVVAQPANQIVPTQPHILKTILQNSNVVKSNYIEIGQKTIFATPNNGKTGQRTITLKVSQIREHSCKICFKLFESLDALRDHIKSHRIVQLPVLKEPLPDETTEDNMVSVPTFNPLPEPKPVEVNQQPIQPANNELSDGKINGVGIVQMLKQLDLPPLIPFVKKHHSEQLPHSCKICFNAFESQEVLKNHLKTHRKLTPLSPTPRKRPSRTRTSKPHPTGTFTCSICSQEHPSPSTLVKHFTQAHPQLTLDHFRCRFCDDIHFSRDTLDPHVASHRGKYECTRCFLEFTTPHRLQIHRQAVHSVRPNARLFRDCQYCGKSFRRGMTLARHVKTHFAGKWTCDICEEYFGERYKLVLHMRQHTGNNPLVCYNCNEHFGDPEMLDEHERQCAMDTTPGKPPAIRTT